MSSIQQILEVENQANYGSRTPSGNARIFNCKQCNRAFTREEHLTRHTLLTHNKLKPFVCGICHRPFSRRDLLLRHAKNLHQGSERAVSRIRKLYKRGSRGDSRVDGDEDEDGDIEEEHKQELEEDEIQLRENELIDPAYDTPEKKRLKMSVNMLVS